MNIVSRVIFVLLLSWAPITYADITFNGFASIRATQANSDGGLEPFSDYKEGQLSFKPESLFALQARADLGDKLSATVQLYADGPNDFDVTARWAYMTYEINDSHQVSMGRFANPMFHQSEYEKVGFAHNFSRLPKAVYLGFDFAVIEGISLDSQFQLSDYTLQTKMLYGSWDGEVYFAVVGQDLPLGFESLYAVNASLSGDWWKVFVGGFAVEMDAAKFDSLVLKPFSTQGVEAAIGAGATQADVDKFYQALNWHGKDGEYWYVGFNIDYNNIIFDYEYVDYGVKDSAGAINKAWFASLGYRFGQAVVTIHKEDLSPEAEHAVFNNVSHPVLSGTGRAIQDALAARNFNGVGVSLRYDFHTNAALKMDFFSGEDSRATVGDYQMFSVGVDLVF